MKSMLALWKRELLEHRGAFVYAPAILLSVLSVGLLMALFTNRLKLPDDIRFAGMLRVFEIGVLAFSAAWWLYLMAALIFYYADAFAADRRNNAMLFWKSMPVTDFKMLMSKMLSGLTVFPAIVFGFVVVSGVMLYLLAVVAQLTVPAIIAPNPVAAIEGIVSIGWFTLVHIVLALLWYAPFFAWIGLLSTLFGRWSIPLAVLIPGVAAGIENALFYRRDFTDSGYIFNFLWNRLQFGVDGELFPRAAFGGPRVNPQILLDDLLGRMDWVSLTGGLVVALVLVYIASEYRRRMIAT